MAQSIQSIFNKLHEESRQKTLGLEARLFALRQLRLLITESEGQILESLAQDLGKPQFEAYTSEILFVQQEISYALKHLKRWLRPQRVSAGLLAQPGKAYIAPKAKGLVLIISAWNYPLQLLFAPLVGAFAAGNRAILKPSEVASATEALVAKLIPRYFPDDLVSVVTGGVEEATELLGLPFDHIFYTGNANVGRIVMSAAAKHLSPVTLELGGKSPAVIWGENDLDIVAKRIVWGKTLNGGQTCVAPDYIILKHSEKEAFSAALERALEDQRSAEASHKIVSEHHFDRLESLITAPDHTPLISLPRDRSKLRFGLQVVEARADSKCMEEEIFGPILPIICVASFDEALAFIRKGERPLAAYIFTEEEEYVARFRAGVTCGGICVRDTIMHLTSTALPFGGVSASGMGHYHGKHTFDLFSHHMSVLERSYRFDLSVRYPPYGRVAHWALKILRFLAKL